MTTRRTWKVGELAKETGVSVRTLHYYEEIGLLEPSGRTAAGHRVYDDADVARLQQIVSLRDVGLSLEQIGAMLARPDASPLSAIQLHVEHLRREVEARQKLCDRLEGLAERLVARGQVSTEEFIEALRWTTAMESMVDEYYTEDQKAYLAERRMQFSEEDMRRVEGEWRELFARLREAMEADTDPADASVQAVLDRMDELIQMFTGGDPGVRESLGRLWSNESAPRQMMGIDAELEAYLARARASR